MTAKARVVDQNTTTTAFSYDALDRTESIGNNTFAYDCDGNRIAKNTTETVWDNDEVSADLTGNDVKVFTEDNSVYCENGTFTFNAIDSKGDVVASTSSYFGDYTYDAYGNDLYNTNTTNPIGYRGYYFDSETGLYYLQARYYDSTTGQFTQEDTVQDANIQYNLYGYCNSNPIKYIDFSGHKPTLHNGSSGKYVKRVQKKMNAIGIRDSKGNKLEVDGDFGAKTEIAVRKFQSVNGLKVDGIVGPKTWKWIDKKLSKFNCYGYAMNTLDWLSPKNKNWYKSVSAFRNSIINDFKGVARAISEKNSSVSRDEYRIAVRIHYPDLYAPIYDFHLMKQDTQGYGYWTEKHGSSQMQYYNKKINPDNWCSSYGNDAGIIYSTKTLYLAVKFTRK